MGLQSGCLPVLQLTKGLTGLEELFVGRLTQGPGELVLIVGRRSQFFAT
jgi:hypothetical protein